MSRRGAAALAAALALAGCGGEDRRPVPAPQRAAVPSIGQLRALYAYDAARPLDVRPEGGEAVSFASPLGGRVPAILVAPRGGGRRPAVIFQHGLGGAEDDFLPEARRLARDGVISLLVAAPHVRPDVGHPLFSGDARDERSTRQNVVDLRRAVDLLTAREDVDRQRIAAVGFSYGSIVVGALAGVEPRLRAAVQVSFGARLEPFLLDQVALEGDALRRYRALMRRFDSELYAPHAVQTLYQYGTADPIVPVSEGERLDRALREPHTTIVYRGGDHQLPGRAVEDRRRWLLERLRVPQRR